MQLNEVAALLQPEPLPLETGYERLCQAAALDRPGRRERGAGSRGYPPLPVRGPALPGTGYSRRAAGCPGHCQTASA